MRNKFKEMQLWKLITGFKKRLWFVRSQSHLTIQGLICVFSCKWNSLWINKVRCGLLMVSGCGSEVQDSNSGTSGKLFTLSCHKIHKKDSKVSVMINFAKHSNVKIWKKRCNYKNHCILYSKKQIAKDPFLWRTW